MNIPTVSIVIPVYNTEKYLQRCIDSLVGQSYKNLEFIFVDDGSRDDSLKIIEEAKKKDNRIKIVAQVNKGPSAARNIGIKNSSGKYIMFCDSDDSVAEEWCEVLINIIEQYPDAWIICGVNIVDENGNIILEQKYGEEGVLKKEEYFQLFCKGLTGYPVNKIYLSRIIKQNGIIFDENICHGEDVIFNLEYLKRVNKIYNINRSYYNYYRYDSRTTLTSSYHKEDFYIYLLMYNSRFPFISSKDMKDFKRYYWNIFFRELAYTMEKNKVDNFWRKIHFNSEIIRHKEFQELLLEFGKEEMHKMSYYCLRCKCYLGYWIIEKLHNIKTRKKGEKINV